MGDNLAEADRLSGGPRDWRTSPLWGLGLAGKFGDAAISCHDGRRATSPSDSLAWRRGATRADAFADCGVRPRCAAGFVIHCRSDLANVSRRKPGHAPERRSTLTPNLSLPGRCRAAGPIFACLQYDCAYPVRQRAYTLIHHKAQCARAGAMTNYGLSTLFFAMVSCGCRWSTLRRRRRSSSLTRATFSIALSRPMDVSITNRLRERSSRSPHCNGLCARRLRFLFSVLYALVTTESGRTAGSGVRGLRAWAMIKTVAIGEDSVFRSRFRSRAAGPALKSGLSAAESSSIAGPAAFAPGGSLIDKARPDALQMGSARSPPLRPGKVANTGVSKLRFKASI